METSYQAGVSESVSMKSIRLTVSVNIEELQKCGVASNYEEYLKDPKFEVLPRMQEIKVKDFYCDKGANETDYRPLPGFSRKVEKGTDKLLDMSSFFASFDQTRRKTKKSVDHVMIVGPAGSGKSTIMRRFAREANNGNIPQIGRDCFVHYLDARRFDPSVELDQHEFIFSNMLRELSGDQMKEAYTWMTGHPEKVVLVVDSLDTLGYDLEKASGRVGPDERALPADILRSIFTGNIFPRCKIVSSSREHGIRNYQGDLRPGRIVSLAGLTQKSIKELTFGFLDGQSGERVFRRLQATPELMILCETPIFLVFSVIAFGNMYGPFVPKTMTGVMVKMLQSLTHSEHARFLGSKLCILRKMKQLSYEGTVAGKVLFSKADLKKVNLSMKDVADLTITVPGPGMNQTRQKVFDGDSITYFAHQSIEEVLCAMYIAEMRAWEFRAFVEDKLHEPRYCVVRRMLCGLVLDPGVREQSKGLFDEASDENRDILTRSMRHKIQQPDDEHDLLELFYSAKEACQAMGDVIPDRLGDVWITSLSALDIHTLGTVLCYPTLVESLHIEDCTSLREGLRRLETDNVKSKLSRLHIDTCPDIRAEGMRLLGHIVKQCQVIQVEFEDCDLSFVDIQNFKDTIEGVKVSNSEVRSAGRYEKTLQSTSDVTELSSRDVGQKNATVSWFQLHNDTSNHDLESNKVQNWVIDLIRCNGEITRVELKDLEKLVINSKITNLSLRGNRSWKPTDITCIARLLTQCGVEELQFQDCTLNGHLLQALEASLKNYKLTTMSFWGNKDWEPDDLSCIGKIVAQCGVQDLQFEECALNTNSLQAFQASVENSKLTMMSFWGNKDWGPDELACVGKIVAHCGVQDLQLEECASNPKSLQALQASVGNSKVNRLHFKRCQDIHADGMISLAHLVKQCEVAEVDFENCDLSFSDIQGFKDILQKAKVLKITVGSKRSEIQLGKEDKEQKYGKVSHLQLHNETPNRERELNEVLVWTIDLIECFGEMTDAELKELEKFMSNSKLAKMNFRESKDWGLDGFSCIGKIVAQCGVQDLQFQDCLLDTHSLQAFEASVGNSKMRSLEFGPLILEAEAASDEHVDVISHLVPNIKERLRLTDLRLSQEQTCVLEKRLLDVAANELLLMFDNQAINGKMLHYQADALKKDLESAENSSDLINVLRQHEKDRPAVISACVRSIAIEDHELGEDDMETIGKIINCSDVIERVVFNGCQLCISSLQRLNRIVCGSKCRKTKLTISKTDNIGILFPEICKFVSSLEITTLDITSNNITYSEVEELSHALDACQVPSLNALDISRNIGICSDGYKTLGVLARIHSLKKIRMVDCNLTDDDMEQFRIGLESTKLDELNISCNILLTASGFETIARLAIECQLQCLKISSCAITEKELRGFNGALCGTSELLVLDLSDNQREADRNYINTVCQLLPFVEELLVLRFGKISSVFIDTIQKELDRSMERKVKVDLGDQRVIASRRRETAGEPKQKKQRLEK